MSDFDQLLAAYHQAVEQWIDSIENEEALANPDHSMTEMEKWDAADLRVREAETAARSTRDAYKNALRQKNYGF